jgi:lipid-A-disaccharide synthase
MKVFLIAGEASGDKLGAALMSGLKELVGDVEFNGVGGPLMKQQGLNSLFEMRELSVMGLAEVLPKLRALFKRRDECVSEINRFAPDVLITIDSPDFCLRVAKKINNVPKVHYVAPSVWAWRPGRAEKMRGVVNHVLALLPFEPPYMQAAGMTCDFVGHPVVSEAIASDAQGLDFRAQHGIEDAPMILALLGSRAGEVTRLAGIFGESLGKLLAEKPDARIVVAAADDVADLVRQQTRNWPGNPLIISGDIIAKSAAFKTADVALAASGTVSLELAANATPMVIAYDMNWLSFQVIKRMFLIDTVTLINLVSETRVVPELLGENCRPDLIAQALNDVMADPTAQIEACNVTMEKLGRGDEEPGLRAARSVLRKIGNLPAG